MTRNLTVLNVGTISIDGQDRECVVLTGDRAALRDAAALLGEQVDLSPAGTLDRLETPDLFWDLDGKVCSEDPGDAWDLNAVGVRDIVQVRCARLMPPQWVATAVTRFITDTMVDIEHRVFATEAEARACYPDTLATARKAAEVQA